MNNLIRTVLGSARYDELKALGYSVVKLKGTIAYMVLKSTSDTWRLT